MCLYTLFEKPLKAEKDIVVYKVLYLENGQYYAPVVNDTKKINYVYTKGLNRPYEPFDETSIEKSEFYGAFRVSWGWLHSYSDEKEANVAMEEFNKEAKVYVLGKGEYVIVKMIIPKDCEYFISDDRKEYCSQCLSWDGEVFKKDENLNIKKLLAY